MIPIALGVNNSSAVNFTASSAVAQRTFVLNNNNPGYVRTATLAQDCLTITFYTASVTFPLTYLYSQAISASSGISYPPAITFQPTSSQFISQSQTAYFTIGINSEVPVSYQWQSQSYSQSLISASQFYSLGSTAAYTGSTTNALTHSGVVFADNNSNYRCVISSVCGNITSSISTLLV